MTERVETVRQLMELLSKHDPEKEVKVLVETDTSDQLEPLYVEQSEYSIIFK